MKRPLRTALALVAALPLLARVALAEPSDADRATARALAREGYEASVRQDYAAAADLFRRADALVHAPTLVLGLARAEAALGQLVEAEEAYTRIVREGIPAHAPPPFAKAVEDAKKEGALIAPRLGWLTIDVAGAAPAEPNVTLDSVPVPSAALAIKRATNPGPHTVRATLDGFLPTEKACLLAEGESMTLRLDLQVDPEKNQAHDEAPKPNPAEPLPAPSTTRRTLAIGALGLGGAALVVGGVTGALVIAKHSSLAGACPDARCNHDHSADVDAYRRLGTVSTVSFIVGGVAASAGVILLLTAPKSSPAATEARISPFVGFQPGGAGAGLLGRF